MKKKKKSATTIGAWVDYNFKWTPYDSMTNEELKARTDWYRQEIIKIFKKELDKKE